MNISIITDGKILILEYEVLALILPGASMALYSLYHMYLMAKRDAIYLISLSLTYT